MPFFLIAFLVSIFTIILTWIPALATTKVGLTDIFPHIYKTAEKTLLSQGLGIFAFAFFLYAILQSQAFQALFASKRKWLEKRKYFTIGLITIMAALIASNLSWFDEFVHFYPLVIPLLLAMGFDTFSAILCLYGGAVAGLLGLVSGQRMNDHFGRCFGGVQGKINYNGFAGIGFRFASFILFVSIIVLFNIWYCSRNQQKNTVRKNELTKPETPPRFNKKRKWILVVAAFFLVGSFAAQVPPVASGLRLNKVAEKVPEHVTNKIEGEDKYEKLGEVEKMKVAKVTENEKEANWGVFGRWEEMAINCWLIIGGIIICLLAKQSIMGNLTSSMQNAIPLLLVYIFAAVPASIIQKSGMSKKLAGILVPETAKGGGSFLALSFAFGASFLLSFVIGSTVALAVTLITTLAPTLLAFGEPALIYAALFAWTGAIMGMAFSPNNGILRASLEKGKITYKQFIKKTWKLAAVMTLAAVGLIIFWTKFMIKG